MGRKYVVELPENTHWIQWIMEGTKDHYPYMDFQNVENLMPYIEPDLEQVRKEAYAEGYKEGMQLSIDDAKLKEAYQRGLSDAWDVARKIWEYGTTTLREIFGEGIMRMDYFMKFTASEAIEKIRQYEQEKKEHEIKAGDEVFCVDCPDIKIWVIDVHDNGFSGIALSDVNGCCDIGDMFKEEPLKNYAKTGNHHEIAEVIAKMREDPHDS